MRHANPEAKVQAVFTQKLHGTYGTLFNTLSIPAYAGAEDANMTEVKGFRAWINAMPGANNKLVVQGSVDTPTTGWTGTLTEVKPDQFNPTIIKLNAELNKPEDASGDALSKADFHFEKENSAAIKTVIISGLGDDFEVPVDEQAH